MHWTLASEWSGWLRIENDSQHPTFLSSQSKESRLIKNPKLSMGRSVQEAILSGFSRIAFALTNERIGFKGIQPDDVESKSEWGPDIWP